MRELRWLKVGFAIALVLWVITALILAGGAHATPARQQGWPPRHGDVDHAVRRWLDLRLLACALVSPDYCHMSFRTWVERMPHA